MERDSQPSSGLAFGRFAGGRRASVCTGPRAPRATLLRGLHRYRHLPDTAVLSGKRDARMVGQGAVATGNALSGSMELVPDAAAQPVTAAPASRMVTSRGHPSCCHPHWSVCCRDCGDVYSACDRREGRSIRGVDHPERPPCLGRHESIRDEMPRGDVHRGPTQVGSVHERFSAVSA